MPFSDPVVVVGGGIIGLSVAYELTTRGEWCIIVESRMGFGEGASSRNSEVIHGGFLSRPNSLKQQMCVSGGKELKRRLSDWGLTRKDCGKLVIAVKDEEIPRLEEIVSEANRIGVPSHWVEEAQVRELEPALSGSFSASAWFPESAVFDTHSYMAELLSRSEAGGSHLLLGSRIDRINNIGGFPEILLEGESISAKAVINSTGIDADKILLRSGANVIDEHAVQEGWIGRWYRLNPRSSEGMKRLVYRTSTPDQPGLGVHTTPDWVGGGIRLGPDSEFLQKVEDSFEDRHKFPDTAELRSRFLSRLGDLYPHLSTDDLTADQAGIRSRAFDPSGDSDFVFLDGSSLGLPRTLHLLGIESPGVTASPSIAYQAVEWLEGFVEG